MSDQPGEIGGEVPDDKILPEYSLKGGVRGKYAERYARGTNLVLLDPDVAAAFPMPSPSTELCAR